jgi:hypothetical protein
VLVAPLAVSLGVSGTVLALMCCLVVMLRTRQYRTGTEVLVGLVSGVLGLLSVGVARPLAAPRLATGGRRRAGRDRGGAAGSHVAAHLAVGAPRPPRDVAETIALLSLLPLLVVATGLLDAVQG